MWFFLSISWAKEKITHSARNRFNGRERKTKLKIERIRTPNEWNKNRYNSIQIKGLSTVYTVLFIAWMSIEQKCKHKCRHVLLIYLIVHTSIHAFGKTNHENSSSNRTVCMYFIVSRAYVCEWVNGAMENSLNAFEWIFPHAEIFHIEACFEWKIYPKCTIYMCSTNWYSLVSTVFIYRIKTSEYSIAPTSHCCVPHAFSTSTAMGFCSLIFEDKTHCCAMCIWDSHSLTMCLVCVCLCVRASACVYG